MSTQHLSEQEIIRREKLDELKKLGIDVVHELNGVGENLQDHLMFRPIYKIQKL